MQHCKKRELSCSFFFYTQGGHQVVFESTPLRYEGKSGRTANYLHEPRSFVPAAQAIPYQPIELRTWPDSTQRTPRL